MTVLKEETRERGMSSASNVGLNTHTLGLVGKIEATPLLGRGIENIM